MRSFRPHLEVLEGRWVPSTLTVTNSLDSGAGSLRADIAAAHNNDTIVFAASLDGQTITLTSGELLINKGLTIQGPGASQLTISGNHASRVFAVAANKTVALSGLTISSGLTGFSGNGGGIVNSGKLTVSDCTLSGNSATNGSGIYNNGGMLTVSGCTLSNNTALGGGFGGGIYNNGGTLTVRNSSLSVNTAPGGGDFNQGEGGGIYNAGTATVSGCTLSNNSAQSGGGIYNEGTLTVRNSAFNGNSPDNIFGSYTNGGGNTFA
jgi:predicted outer membrane repeat protein